METLSIFVTDELYVDESHLVLSLLIFDSEAIESFQEYSETLKSIRNRLESEGYLFKDGKIYKPADIISRTP